MSRIDITKYAHSPVHKAVVTRDYTGLKRILNSLPRFLNPAEIRTEADSIAEEAKADAISGVIDRRDVPGRETPLHLAVKLRDTTSTEMLMAAGADWSLQNESGWSSLQEAICSREESIAMIIVRHYQPLAWAKWCRRLPRLVGAMKRMRDFYMEITFHFDSSVIPFISRIAPSDTYKIWKRGSNLRADMTLAGFDGFRIQRSDQSVLFLGDGSNDGKIPRGSLFMISHKNKEVTNALDGAGAQATETEIQEEIAAMTKTNIFRPGIDVTEAMLFPQLTWRRQEKTEMVGPWKAKVYDMHNVVVSVKSRCVPGVMTDEELSFSSSTKNDLSESEDYSDMLTPDEKRQLEYALGTDSSKLTADNGPDRVIAHRHSCFESREIPIEGMTGCISGEDKKGRFAPRRNSLYAEEEARHSLEVTTRSDELRRARSTRMSSTMINESVHKRKEAKRDSEYKKGVRPTIWLSPNFPLRTEELLPLLDILSNKVKAIRRLRELLTTKLIPGTFPVKVAIPVVPTIRVLVTFTKFEELEPSEDDEFSTPPSSPRVTGGREKPGVVHPSIGSSWVQWIKSPYNRQIPSAAGPRIRVKEIHGNLFAIPSEYTWITSEEKKKSKGKSKSNSNRRSQMNEDL
ncbi:hypothetical protein MKX01_037272 [Papaver californicum]|nr:hypothetical protein MKX01_037272 [Papaver californicum]